MLGITSTGEGVTFMMLWTFAGQFGVLGDDYTFQKAESACVAARDVTCCRCSCVTCCHACARVLHVYARGLMSTCAFQVFYTSFFPLFCSPPIVWAARCVPDRSVKL